ncbi:MAG TPA: VWA domain-containing protein [Candidatus Acidoferrum sp.]|nr:VWA domain-containing protein [Candidatus Acidoferrum sp.]
MILRVARVYFCCFAPLAFFAGAFSAASQEKPDRPPWAQPSTSQPQPPPPSSGQPPTTPGPMVLPPVQPPERQKEPQTPKGTIKVNVNLVNVLVSVLDENKRPAPNLPQEAFQVLEEGVPQKVEFFEPETKLPLDLALMIDASMSAHIDFQYERDAASRFIRQVLRPDDRMSVFSFDETVTQRTTFTERVQTLTDAVARIPDGAGTSIYDALLLGSQALEKRGGERRRVIILVTDGGETTSHTDFEAARRAALRGEVLLYTILVRTMKSENGRNTAGEHALQTITETTGGAMFFPDSPQELPIIFDRIDAELRTQYRLAYYPNPRGQANTYRKIEVKMLPGYAARHRTAYLVTQ